MSAPAIEADGPGAATRQVSGKRFLPRLVRHEFTLVAAGYLLAALAVTALLWRDPASRIVRSGPGDPDLFAWWLRYSADSIAHWRLPALITNGMNAPTGVSAMWNTSILVPGIALSPVTLLFGPHVSINVLLTVGFAGSATALYWVLRRWSVGVLAAVAGGLVYGFSPALTGAALGHYHLQFAVFPPLIAHVVARLVTLRGEPLRTGAALGVLTALQLLTGEEMLFNTGVTVLVGLLVAGASKWRSAWRISAWRIDDVLGIMSGLLVAIGVFVMIAGYPLWIQFAGPLKEHGSPWLVGFYKNDLAGFVQPSRFQLVHSAASAGFADQFGGGLAEYLGYLGWPMLFVIGWATGALWQVLAARVAAVTFFVMEVLSLGGTLLMHGHVYAWFKLPWYLLQNLPIDDSVVVDRFSITADACAAVLLAIAIDTIWRAIPKIASTARRRGVARAVLGLGVVVTVVPLLPAPLPTATLTGVPAGWTQVMTDLRLPDGASVLVVPVPADTFTTPIRWQANTGQPASMVGGYFIGPIWNGQAYAGGMGLDKVPLYLNLLWQESPGPIDAGGVQTSNKVQSVSAAAAWISSSGLSAVVAVTTLGSPLANYLTEILGAPVAQSGDVLGWRVGQVRQ